jgi:chromosome segregation ATPase
MAEQTTTTPEQVDSKVPRTVHERFMLLQSGATPMASLAPSSSKSVDIDSDAHLDFIKAEVGKSTVEVKQNTQSLKDQETMIKALTVTSTNQGTALTNVESKVNSVHTKIEKLEQTMAEYPTVSQIKEMGATASVSSPVSGDLEARMDNIQTTLTSVSFSVSEDIASLKKDLSEIKTSVPSASEIKNATVSPDDIRKVADECCQENKDAVASLEKRFNYTSNEVGTIKNDVSNLETSVSSTSDELSKVKQVITSIEPIVSQMKTDITESTAVLSHVDDKLSALAPDVENVRLDAYTRIAALKSEIDKNSSVVSRMAEDVNSNKQMNLDFKTFMATMAGNMDSLKSAVQAALEESRVSTAIKLGQFEENLSSVRDDIKNISIRSAGGLKFDGRSTVTADTSNSNPGELPLSSNICYSRATGNSKQAFTLPKCSLDGKVISFYASRSPGGCVFLVDNKNLTLPEGNMIRVEDGGSVSLVYSDSSSTWAPMHMNKVKFVLAYEMP